MAKKIYEIKVNDKSLVSTKPVADKPVKVDKSEVEQYGVLEINNASSKKMVKNKTEKGFEKNLTSSAQKTVKSKTSKVDDYFDFSFRKRSNQQPAQSASNVANQNKKEVKVDETMTKAALKMNKIENDMNLVGFDSEVNQVIRVARIGSLFDCEKCMIN